MGLLMGSCLFALLGYNIVQMSIASAEHERIAVLFSGQGVQAPGMGEDAYKRYDIAKEVFQDASDVVGVNMAEVCFGGLTYLLERPEIAQTAIATASLAEYRAWVDESARLPDVITGLSMGLWTALSPTRVISSSRSESDTKSIDLIHQRARIMQEVAKDNPGGMGVVLGQFREEVSRHLPEGLKIGVSRMGHQLVTGGEAPLAHFIHEWAQRIGEKKARRLPISMAAHHDFQLDTIAPLTPLLERAVRHEPYIDFLGNSPEYSYLKTREAIIRHLLSQMVEEARFDWTAQQLAADGIKYVVECGDRKRGLTKDVTRAGDIKVIKFPPTLETSLQTA